MMLTARPVMRLDDGIDNEGTCDVLVGINDDIDIAETCDKAIWKGISDDDESERLAIVVVMLSDGGLSGTSNCSKSSSISF